MSALSFFPYGIQLIAESAVSADILFVKGADGEITRLNESGVPSLCLATADSVFGIAGIYEKFQSTNTPLADWRRIAPSADPPEPDNPSGLDKWRNAIISYDPTTYFANLAAIESYLAANSGVFGGYVIPGTGNPIIAGNLAGKGSNILYATNNAGVWSVVESTRPLLGGDATWVRQGTYANSIIGWRLTTEQWALIGDGNDGTGGGGGGTSTDYCYQRWAGATGVRNFTAIDNGVKTSLASSVKWMVAVRTNNTIEQYEIMGAHNGTASSNATIAQLSGPFIVNRIGSLGIPGVSFSVKLSAGTPQKIQLWARADVSADFQVSMIGWTQHSPTARYTLSQLEG